MSHLPAHPPSLPLSSLLTFPPSSPSLLLSPPLYSSLLTLLLTFPTPPSSSPSLLLPTPHLPPHLTFPPPPSSSSLLLLPPTPPSSSPSLLTLPPHLPPLLPSSPSLILIPFLQNWAYYHPSYCSYHGWVPRLSMWETRVDHLDRYEFLCWSLTWGRNILLFLNSYISFYFLIYISFYFLIHTFPSIS